MNVQALHPEFLSTLVNRALSRLLATSTTPLENDAPPDPSYDSTLARWILWLVDRCDLDQGSDENTRADIVASLLTVLGPGSKHLVHAKKKYLGTLKTSCSHADIFYSLNELLSALCAGYPSLSSACTVLQSSQQISSLVCLSPKSHALHPIDLSRYL